MFSAAIVRFGCVLSLFSNTLPSVLSSFEIISLRIRELVALLLCPCCYVAVSILWLFLTAPLVGLQFVIVVFPRHTHLFKHLQCFIPLLWLWLQSVLML